MAISKMKNGRWRVSVYQPNDAPRSKGFQTREEPENLNPSLKES